MLDHQQDRQKIAPFFKEITNKCHSAKLKAMPGSAFEKALNYFENHVHGLKRGLTDPEIEEAQLKRDPLVGSIFENLVVLECLKHRLNQGKQSNLYFFRDSHGNEVDLIMTYGRRTMAIEITSGVWYPYLKNGIHHTLNGKFF